ncbi:hypothetical protein HYU23_04320 [Candidatus Woesearchaeota archaeon]|nr:hypothetical protein [Candidatus Woesearchaeota archaeon]
MDTKPLEDLGLTKTEIKIYLALLKLGQTTTTPIVKEAQIHASKVYEFLQKLVHKGLVSYVIKSNKKYFTITEPNYLKELLKEKEIKLKKQKQDILKLIPELNRLRKNESYEIKAGIYEGLSGIKFVYEKIISTLSKGEIQYIIGAPRIINEKIEGYLIDWHKRRIRKGVKCKYIYDSNVRDYGSVREEMLNTEVRYLPKNIVSPIWIEIFKDHVIIGHMKEYNAILFLIYDRDIAKGYLDYFNLIWKASEK